MSGSTARCVCFLVCQLLSLYVGTLHVVDMLLQAIILFSHDRIIIKKKQTKTNTHTQSLDKKKNSHDLFLKGFVGVIGRGVFHG